MKSKATTLLMTAALIGSLTLTSCKKNWVCTCNTAGNTTTHEIDDQTLLNAKAKCDSYNSTVLGVTTSCTLNN